MFMPESKKTWQSKAATLAHTRTKIGKKELKKLLGISSKRITLLIKEGMPFIQIGEKRLFLKDSVLRWLKSQELPTPPEKKLAQPLG